MTFKVELRCDAVRSLDCVELRGGNPQTRGVSIETGILTITRKAMLKGWKHSNVADVCPACVTKLLEGASDATKEDGNASSDPA